MAMFKIVSFSISQDYKQLPTPLPKDAFSFTWIKGVRVLGLPQERITNRNNSIIYYINDRLKK